MLNKENPLTMFETYFAKLCFLCPLIFVACIGTAFGAGSAAEKPSRSFRFAIIAAAMLLLGKLFIDFLESSIH